MFLSGRASGEGTRKALESRGAFDPASCVPLVGLNLTISAIGLGTGQFQSINAPLVVQRCSTVVDLALRGGINVIDCASNYGSAESIVGGVLADLVTDGIVDRSCVVICSKGGYPDDHRLIDTPQPSVLDPWTAADIAADGHCLAPGFLHRQLMLSRQRLQVETIDLYFLHNPEEQLLLYGTEVFEERVLRAFVFLEHAVAEGWIVAYGVASAEGFRVAGPVYHSVERLVTLAERAGGPRHHFAVVQLPFSLAQPEALLAKNHTVHGENLSALATAKAFGLAVFGSAALNRMILPPRTLSRITELCPALDRPAQAALNFARSAPGIDCALFGTTRPAHMSTALEVLAYPPIDLVGLR